MFEVRSVQLAAPYSPELIAELDHLLRVMESAVKEDDSERYIDMRCVSTADWSKAAVTALF